LEEEDLDPQIHSSTWICLINPAHPDFKTISLGKTEPFAFDSRLFA